MSRDPNPEPITNGPPGVPSLGVLPLGVSALGVRPYGRQAKKRPSTHLMVCLHQDALEAVIAAMAAPGLTKSGAIHHLVRLGAGLKPLIP